MFDHIFEKSPVLIIQIFQKRAAQSKGIHLLPCSFCRSIVRSCLMFPPHLQQIGKRSPDTFLKVRILLYLSLQHYGNKIS